MILIADIIRNMCVPSVMDRSHKPLLAKPISLFQLSPTLTLHRNTLQKIYSKNRLHNPDMLYNCMSFQAHTKIIEFTRQNPCLLFLSSLPSIVSCSFCRQAFVWFMVSDHMGRERTAEIKLKTKNNIRMCKNGIVGSGFGQEVWSYEMTALKGLGIMLYSSWYLP